MNTMMQPDQRQIMSQQQQSQQEGITTSLFNNVPSMKAQQEKVTPRFQSMGHQHDDMVLGTPSGQQMNLNNFSSQPLPLNLDSSLDCSPSMNL
jgi:hypothetical protein